MNPIAPLSRRLRTRAGTPYDRIKSPDLEPYLVWGKSGDLDRS